MKTLLEDLQHYQNKRRFPDWQPKPAGSSYVPANSTSHELILRCLDFLPLEMTVAEWDMQAAADNQEQEIERILERNAADETKHDLALSFLSEYVGKGEPCQEAAILTHKWMDDKSHPVIKMYALEIGVFFSILPTLTNHGDIYANLVAQWISDDEVVHVNTGLRLMKALGLKVTPSLMLLVYETNKYIYQPLGETEAVKRAERAIRRMMSGKDPAMLSESLPSTIAFFEQHSNNSIAY